MLTQIFGLVGITLSPVQVESWIFAQPMLKIMSLFDESLITYDKTQYKHKEVEERKKLDNQERHEIQKEISKQYNTLTTYCHKDCTTIDGQVTKIILMCKMLQQLQRKVSRFRNEWLRDFILLANKMFKKVVETARKMLYDMVTVYA